MHTSIDRSGDDFEEYICNKTYLTCTVSQERKGPEVIFEQIINKSIFMQTPIKLLGFALGLLDCAVLIQTRPRLPSVHDMSLDVSLQSHY